MSTDILVPHIIPSPDDTHTQANLGGSITPQAGFGPPGGPLVPNPNNSNSNNNDDDVVEEETPGRPTPETPMSGIQMTSLDTSSSATEQTVDTADADVDAAVPLGAGTAPPHQDTRMPDSSDQEPEPLSFAEEKYDASEIQETYDTLEPERTAGADNTPTLDVPAAAAAEQPKARTGNWATSFPSKKKKKVR